MSRLHAFIHSRSTSNLRCVGCALVHVPRAHSQKSRSRAPDISCRLCVSLGSLEHSIGAFRLLSGGLCRCVLTYSYF